MRESVRRSFEGHGMSILGRSIIAGLLVAGLAELAPEPRGSQWSRWGPTRVSAIQDDPEDHLHLDPAQPGGHRGTYTPDGERRGKRQPGHLLDRRLGEGKLQHLGCDRHLRRRRDLRHRRQPGRQRQLRRRHPGPAVLRRRSGTQTITFTSTPPSPAVVGGTYTPTASGGGESATRSPSRSTPRPRELQHLGCDRHLRRRRDLRHRRQPGRQRQLQRRHPGPAVLRPGHGYPDHHLHLDAARARRSWAAPTPRRRAAAASGNPVTFSIDPSANRNLQHLGRRRHLPRRRDLRHRRQPGRQRQLRRRHPGPAVLRSGPGTQTITFTSTPPSPTVVGGTYTVDGERRGQRQPGHLLDRRLGAMGAAASRVPPSPSSPSGPASSTPTRPATPTTTPPPRSSSPSTVDTGTQTITFTSTPPSPRSSGAPTP